MSVCTLPLVTLHIQRHHVVFNCASSKNTSAVKRNDFLTQEINFFWNYFQLNEMVAGVGIYIFHVKTTIDHFGKKLENMPSPMYAWAILANLGNNIRAKALQKATEKIFLSKGILGGWRERWWQVNWWENRRECSEEVVNIKCWMTVYLIIWKIGK